MTSPVLNGHESELGTITEVSRRVERQLLAKLFNDPVAVMTAVEATGLVAGEFLGDDHSLIFDAVTHCAHNEGRTDMDVVTWYLDLSGRLADAGGRETLLQLARMAAEPAILQLNPGEAVAAVRNLSNHRRMRERLDRSLAELEADPAADAHANANKLAEELIQLGRRRPGRRAATLRQGQFYPASQDLVQESRTPGTMPEGAIPTGISRLDTTLGGVLKLGRLTLLLGPSDAGKTTLAAAWVENAAMALRSSGGGAAEVFLEGTAQEMMRRLVSLRAARLTMTTPTVESLTSAGRELDAVRLYIDDGAWHADEIAPLAARLAEQGVKLLVVDSAEHLGALGADATDPLDGLEYKLQRLKQAAKTNHIAVLVNAAVDVATIPQVLGKLAGRQRLTDVAMALLPRPNDTPGGEDQFGRDLHVFHNHLGPQDKIALRLRPDLGGLLQLEARS